MHETTQRVVDHYEPAAAADRVADVTRLLARLGDGPLTAEQLGPLDQYHTRGLAATKELATFGEIARGERVLDAGSGLGGPSRFLASEYDCDVTGVDLTPSFVALATMLAERTGLAHKVRYEVGNIVTLPFPDASFDVVWTQHVVMNIAERDALYRGFARVLRPGGRLVFFDGTAGDQPGDFVFPVPWATSSEASFLLTEAQTRAVLANASLTVERWNDLTDAAIAATAAQLGAPRPPVSLVNVMGDRLAGMAANMVENARRGRLRMVMGLARRAV